MKECVAEFRYLSNRKLSLLGLYALQSKQSRTWTSSQLRIVALDKQHSITLQTRVRHIWANLIILLAGDPTFGEPGEGAKDRASYPGVVLSLRCGDDLHLHSYRGKRYQLPFEPLCEAGEHGGPAREDEVAKEVLA